MQERMLTGTRATRPETSPDAVRLFLRTSAKYFGLDDSLEKIPLGRRRLIVEQPQLPMVFGYADQLGCVQRAGGMS